MKWLHDMKCDHMTESTRVKGVCSLRVWLNSFGEGEVTDSLSLTSIVAAKLHIRGCGLK